MDERLDRADSVRPGEELEIPVLRDYLQEIVGGELDDLKIRQFRSGHSNLTYLVDWGDREYVLRRPPAGTRPESGHDMGREYRILEALDAQVNWVPTPLALCEDERVLGAPFYLMERVSGVILRGDDGGVTSVSDDQWRALSQVCVDMLARVHDVDVDAPGLSDLGRPRGYIDRQIDGWIRRWETSRTEAVDTIESVTQWLDRNRPGDDLSQTALIHNDFKYDNLVLDPDDLTQVRAVLDWELATVGDRRMDVGTTLAYWTEPDDDPALLALGLGPTVQPGNFSRREVVQYYMERTGLELDEILYFYVYGLFKVAVIGQQIYYRYHHGQTSDERFAGLIHAVKGLGRQAVGALEADEV